MTLRQHARHANSAAVPSGRSNTLTSSAWQKVVALSLAASVGCAVVAAPVVVADSSSDASQEVTLIAQGEQALPVPAENPVPFVASADVASVPFVELPTVSVSADELDEELVHAVNQAAQTLSRVSGSENGVSDAAEDLIATLDAQGGLVAASLNSSTVEDLDVELSDSAFVPEPSSADSAQEGASQDGSAREVLSNDSLATPDSANQGQVEPDVDASEPASRNHEEPQEVDVPSSTVQSKLASRILVQIEAVENESPAVVDVFYQRPDVDKRATLEAAAYQFSPGSYVNGEIPASELCVVNGGTMRCDAAAMFTLMDQDFAAKFGHSIGIVSSYRTYAQQVAVKASRGHFAAVPGTSNHGLGLALDLSGNIARFGTAERAWIEQNGPSYGWIAPDWAAHNGSKPEPWHYEFVGAPKPSSSSEMWTYYDRVDRAELTAVVKPYKLSVPQNLTGRQAS